MSYDNVFVRGSVNLCVNGSSSSLSLIGDYTIRTWTWVESIGVPLRCKCGTYVEQ